MNYYHQLKASKQTQKFQDVAEQQMRNFSTEDSSSQYPKSPSRKPTSSFEMELELPYKIQKHDLDFQDYGIEVIESDQISQLVQQFQQYRKLENRSPIWQHINSVKQNENSIILRFKRFHRLRDPTSQHLQEFVMEAIKFDQMISQDDLIQYEDGTIHIRASSQLKQGFRQPILKALEQFCNDFSEIIESDVLQQILHAFGVKDSIQLSKLLINDKYLHFLRLNLLEQLRK